MKSRLLGVWHEPDDMALCRSRLGLDLVIASIGFDALGMRLTDAIFPLAMNSLHR